MVGATVALVLVTGRRTSSFSIIEPSMISALEGREVVARVDSSVLLLEDINLVGIDNSSVGEWVEDELLAELAVEKGLENVRLSRLIQNRARQLYLRDELLSSVYSRIPFPDSIEVFEYMRTDSLLFMVERQYFQILVADRHLADSIYTRLSRGENFQITAERLSIGQKAGIGGDLGFLTAGELSAYGLPDDQMINNGLSGILESQYGWHIFLVDDARPLTDTSRVIWSLADYLYGQRLRAARDSLLIEAMENREVYIDSTLIPRESREVTDPGDSVGREAE
ncbi:MAG: peptidylprolyl isomerase [Candidatus Aegiribacteria sp.]|nr:peptidylprolyl isomerase [Candidatus Aegiribacteria sp.]